MALELNARMNNEIRAAIKAKAFKTSGVEEAKKSLVEKRAAFAEKVRQRVMALCGVDEEMLNSEYEKLRKTEKQSSNSDANGIGKFISVSVYRDHDRYVDVAINGQVRYLRLNGSENGEDTHISIASVNEGGPWVNSWRVMLADDSLMGDLMALDREASDIAAKQRTFDSTLDAVLKSARTVKQLLTAWPDAKELLPEDMQRATGTALAINPAELNAICGIPSGK